MFHKKEDAQYTYPFYLNSVKNNMYLPYIYPESNLPNTENYKLFGISYKYNIFNNSAALRFQTFFNYNSNKDKTKNSVYSTNSNDYHDVREKLSIGYEWHKNFKRTQFYYGIDFSYVYSKTKNVSKSSNKQQYYPNNQDTAFTWITVVYNNTTDDRINRYGINPLFGLKFFITSNLSISTEAQFVFDIYHKKLVQDNTCDHPTYSYVNSTTTNKDGFSSLFGPIVNLSINYHF